MLLKRSIILVVIGLSVLSCTPDKAEENNQTANPLPSWNESSAKSEIIDFVKRVTTENGPDYVSPADRIATFDNDGTLWSEQPLYFQLEFALDRISEMADKHPEWKDDSLMIAAQSKNLAALAGYGMEGLQQIIGLTHAGMTTTEFEETVLEWTSSAKHPTKNMRYIDMVYQPMLELLDYLRANDFKTFIVSGGGIDFMRPWTDEVYKIPTEQVVGSQIDLEFSNEGGTPVIKRLPGIFFVDDKETKPVAIQRHIGKRPIAAFGNSDGDLQMLQWTAGGEGARLMAFVHHTDADREWAYDRDSHIGKFDKGLDEAKNRGWTVIDMKNDWKEVYPSSPK